MRNRHHVRDNYFYVCHGQGCRYIGDGRPPTFNRNPYNWYIKPYYWVDFPIPYYMEISWELIDPSTAHVPCLWCIRFLLKPQTWETQETEEISEASSVGSIEEKQVDLDRV